jgi:AraC family transcriptional regulator, alkane utilization regulator
MQRLNTNGHNDPLGDVLGEVRFRSSIFCRSEMSAPWGFGVLGRDLASFHFVERGSCWLEVADAGVRIQLVPGDLVVLPHGNAHVVRDEPNSAVTLLDDLLGKHKVQDGTLRFGGGGPHTSLVCGGFLFTDRNALPFLPALPPVLHVRERSRRVQGWLRIAEDVIGDGISAHMGENTMLSRIADLMFIEAVRSHFTDAAGSPRGWFAALRDRHVGRAISLIHGELHRAWTVNSLAEAVGMSRTAFALRFSLLLGESPIRYLTGRRIARAGALLLEAGMTIAKIAAEVGYDSEVAFSKAFKRHVGLSPADYRKEAYRSAREPP